MAQDGIEDDPGEQWDQDRRRQEQTEGTELSA
jgi:hypothetical protein